MKLIDNANNLNFRDESEIIPGAGFPWESRKWFELTVG